MISLRKNCSWLVLNHLNTGERKEFTIPELEQELIKQINERYESTDFFQNNYKNCKSGSKESYEFHIDKLMIAKMNSLLQDEKMHPILTFHGTEKDICYKIIEMGYRVPGKDGVKIRHGNAWGPGIYTSPFFDFASNYAGRGKIEKYHLINLVFLGKHKMIGTRDNIRIVDDRFTNNTDTKIIFGYSQVISSDTNRVFPLGIMKLSL